MIDLNDEKYAHRRTLWDKCNDIDKNDGELSCHMLPDGKMYISSKWVGWLERNPVKHSVWCADLNSKIYFQSAYEVEFAYDMTDDESVYLQQVRLSDENGLVWRSYRTFTYHKSKDYLVPEKMANHFEIVNMSL